MSHLLSGIPIIGGFANLECIANNPASMTFTEYLYEIGAQADLLHLCVGSFMALIIVGVTVADC
jgi:hypothetical protein